VKLSPSEEKVALVSPGCVRKTPSCEIKVALHLVKKEEKKKEKSVVELVVITKSNILLLAFFLLLSCLPSYKFLLGLTLQPIVCPIHSSPTATPRARMLPTDK